MGRKTGSRADAKLHPAERYARDVVEERIPACRWTVLACARHLRDLETGRERGLYFDEEAGRRVIEFFRFLKHSKGEWAGSVFSLSPWQQFTLWCVFGWKRADGLRRFRTAYEEVPRKNGKSTMAAGVGNYLFIADDEPGAEVYTAATKRDQAKITHSEATRMVKASPLLRKRVGIYKDNLHVEGTASKFEPLGSDENTMDGLNVHGAIIDELHAHKNRGVWDILETAMGARRQPLILAITTAGTDTRSICFEQHSYLERILTGAIQDDSYFGVIYTLDEPEFGPDGEEIRAGDDWRDPQTWAKANPNLGVSVKPDDLARLAAKAQEVPTALNSFLRLRLNKWTQALSRFIPLERWDLCNEPVATDGLRGRRCYAGLDLSSTTDLSALVLVFPPECDGDLYRVLCRFWVPQEAMDIRGKRDRVPYDVWVRQGWITATPGAVIDYGFIKAQIMEDAEAFDLQELAFDRWGAAKIQTELAEEGITVVGFGQGFASMSSPTKELQKLVLSRQIAHGANPVLRWCCDNMVVRQDPAGNMKPDKDKSRERIDGMVSLIMALDRALRNAGGGRSVYETRGVRAC